MGVDFENVYNDRERSASYAKLEFPGTYYLAFRDLPALIERHVSRRPMRGGRALDFGCGTGRSTRYLHGLGFDVVGIDISEPMLALARERDPAGEYRLVPDGDLEGLESNAFDLVLSAFTFDNIPTRDRKVALFTSLKRSLKPGGRIVSLVSSPEIYVNEWTSFSTKDYPQNRSARCGDRVLIVMLDVEDRRPVEDILWTDEGYLDVYGRAGLTIVEMSKPLAAGDEEYEWVNETKIAPWVVYVLEKAEERRR